MVLVVMRKEEPFHLKDFLSGDMLQFILRPNWSIKLTRQGRNCRLYFCMFCVLVLVLVSGRYLAI